MAPVSTVACVDSVKTTDGELVDNAKIEGAANAASSDSGLTPAEAGGVGAGVTIGVIGLVAAAAAFMGLLHFGKTAKAAPVPRTDDSVSSVFAHQTTLISDRVRRLPPEDPSVSTMGKGKTVDKQTLGIVFRNPLI